MEADMKVALAMFGVAAIAIGMHMIIGDPALIGGLVVELVIFAGAAIYNALRD